ncbi:cholecystokinin receptor type A-like [Mizuhopecten yessoensis]|uniref:Orexin receptor type 2 n=1 Tax=Mizuhopecten yessoensis TaxID=6573 RepID=A0A210PSC6_MIZYE|nr:cholecystokinin receptor type A-like [Mizuhopecten yessoensis]XP_021376355.1 cholecystokinin receptor type A-like [Mizuhopecten yessoensis]OWF39389.1 Orexin receptor type 2 [Mizuhopecten yessoensis]
MSQKQSTNMTPDELKTGLYNVDPNLNGSISIDDFNHDEMMERLGAIIVVGFLSIVGIIGNIHVLYIYGTKFKRTNQRIFILFLGYLDLFMCLVGMPFVISELLLPLKFTSGIACKVLRCTNYFTGGSSAFLLVVIAVERYRKICRPLESQMTIKGAKVTSFLALLLALLLSWPAAILYGYSTVDTGYPDLMGATCYIDDKFIKTKYTTYYNAVIILVIIIANIALIVLYIKVVRRVYQQRAFRSDNKSHISRTRKKSFEPGQTCKVVTNSEFQFCSMDLLKASQEDLTTCSGLDDSANAMDDSVESNKHGNRLTKPGNRKKSKKVSNRSARVTMMLFIITLVYFISFLPHLILKILADTKKDFLPSLDFTGTFMFYLFLYSIFINNMANPIIYGFCDPKFMEHIRTIYRRPCLSDRD